MAQLVWDAVGERRYEFGVDHGVLYRRNAANTGYETGVAWNGLTSVKQNADGGDSAATYADNILYIKRRSLKTDKFTVEALYYPDEFAECDGSAVVTNGLKVYQQKRRSFGFAYRSSIGNDTDRESHGYRLHIFWNARVNPAETAYSTINNNTDNTTFSWETEVEGEGDAQFGTVPYIEIDSTRVDPITLAELEDILYGTDSENPRLPTPTQVLDVLRCRLEPLLDAASSGITDSKGGAVYAGVRLF